jgi:hypothetical protein
MSREAILIKQSRRTILRTLNMMYPNSMFMCTLCNCMISEFPLYDDDLLAKDTTYLQDKGYLAVTEKSPVFGPLPFKKRLVKLTASGKEIADQIMIDPALEIG